MSETTLTGSKTNLIGDTSRGVWALVLAWSSDAPERSGEVALIPLRGIQRLLGRGAPQPSDRAERLLWFRQRPGSQRPRPPLNSPYLSRQQLVVTPGATSLSVTNIGRAPLFVDGRPVDRADCGVGTTLRIGADTVLYVEQRPAQLLAMSDEGFAQTPFGEADSAGLVGESPCMWELRRRLAFVAQRDDHVLVTGETGTGKEATAQALHVLSARAEAPLVSRNAATLPEGLAEAELFGHAKNYPNPGMAARKGLFGEADGSTLFLDEIGELSESIQSRLLRVLDAGEYQRLGDTGLLRTDVRVIGATNRSVESLKNDLAARLPLRLRTPPLDDRRCDVPLLARSLLISMAARDDGLRQRFFEADTGRPRLTVALVDALLRHAYSANVRELKGLLWEAMASSSGDTVDLTPEVVAMLRFATPSTDAEPTLEQIHDALAATDGNRTEAAERLGLSSRHALYRLMKKYDDGTDG